MSRAPFEPRPLKVVLFDPRGAVPDYVEQLGSALADRGLDVIVIAAPLSNGRSLGTRPLFSYHPSFALRTHGGIGNALPYIAGWVRTVTLLVRERPDVLHVQFVVRPRLESRLLGILGGVFRMPLVVTVHNVVPHEPRPADREAFARLYRRAAGLIVHSSASEARLRQMAPEVEPRRVCVIPHGNFAAIVDGFRVGRAEARRGLGLPEGNVVIVAPGKLRPYKGLSDLVAAFAGPQRGAAATLLIAGAPDDRAYADQLGSLAGRAGGADIRVISRYLSREEFHRCFVAADVVALPYRDIDQSGILLYAMTCGVPVVASRLPAFEETLGPDDTGVLVTPGSRDELSRALTQLIRDPDLRQRLGSAARARALRDFGWARIASETHAVYREVVHRSADRVPARMLDRGV